MNCAAGNHYKEICEVLGFKYNRYSNIHEDTNGNFKIENDSEIYNYIENLLVKV